VLADEGFRGQSDKNPPSTNRAALTEPRFLLPLLLLLLLLWSSVVLFLLLPPAMATEKLHSDWIQSLFKGPLAFVTCMRAIRSGPLDFLMRLGVTALEGFAKPKLRGISDAINLYALDSGLCSYFVPLLLTAH
jgi:hypothetical protein